ncbi:DUF6344 domain-containing protein [Streptomyces sp. NPDC051561]|uniref:DUF6344 domain-containing protein n=1 Tax=Streptomyces sp. NPDC051561 TaxID=3365658 RepID=UPI00379F274C
MKTMWTALISAIVALLATLGFIAPASATTAPADTANGGPADAPQSPAQAPAPASAPGSASTSAAGQLLAPAGRTAEAAASWYWSGAGVSSSVPPTMKQRITAEAHGGSPAFRQVPALDRANGVAKAELEAAA